MLLEKTFHATRELLIRYKRSVSWWQPCIHFVKEASYYLRVRWCCRVFQWSKSLKFGQSMERFPFKFYKRLLKSHEGGEVSWDEIRFGNPNIMVKGVFRTMRQFGIFVFTIITTQSISYTKTCVFLVLLSTRDGSCGKAPTLQNRVCVFGGEFHTTCELNRHFFSVPWR